MNKYKSQLAENDNTVKRYKAEIEKTREFSISKFAKDLLEVRDNLSLAAQNTDLKVIEESEDLAEVKGKFKDLAQGMEMTTKTMDNVLKRFGVVQVDPLGEKFDPNVHEAVFMMQDPQKDNNTVGNVM